MKNYLIALLLASSFAACAPKNEPIVAATYNIRMNNPADSLNAWPNRAANVRQLIRFNEWDIFGTQEGFASMLDDLSQLSEYSRIGVGREDGAGAGEHSAIFYRTSRFELRGKGDFWLSETPEKPSAGWDAQIFRICSWGRFVDKLTRKEFYFFCAHYDHLGRQARVESSKLVLKKIAEIAGNEPVVLVGDLNATPDDEAITTLAAAMNDAQKATAIEPYGPEGTFSGFEVKEIDADKRIDYVFTGGGIETLKYGVLTDSRQGRYFSDHLPVVAKIAIK